MKKSIILLLTLVVSAGALVSFKEKTATKYGGSASAKIAVYKYSTLFPYDKSKGEKVKSVTVNATTSCTSLSSSDAKSSLKNNIELEAGYKTSSSQYWDYESEIDYRINSCN